MNETYKLTQLKNGIRIAWMPYKSAVSYAGVILNVGSASETENEHGIAHFIEHMLFKGTESRSSYKIINYLENVGGELNAFTSKEETTVYAAFPNQYYKRALDLISDITFYSTFPEKEMEKERNVILDEISSYKDTPSENIFDEFDELMLKGHSMAHNILGTKKSLKKTDRSKLMDFYKKQYFSNSPVLFFMGNIPYESVLKYATQHLESLELHTFSTKPEILQYTPVHDSIKEDTYQAHFITGMPTIGYAHPDKIAMLMLNNLLGGPSMNSRLNMNLRERNGIAYNVESTYMSYADFGTINVYFGTDTNIMDKSKQIVYKELKKLRDNKLSATQLKQFKTQFYGQVALARESKENLFLNFGKTILRFNRFPMISEVHANIEKVNAEKLLELANQYLDPAQFSSLTIK